MHTDKTNINNPQKKSTGKPIDTTEIDQELESPVEKASGKGLNETRPGPGNEVDGQVAKM